MADAERDGNLRGMALPLQPSLRPWPPWAKRALTAAAVVAALLALGLVSGARQRPVELVLTGPGHELEYARDVERLIAGARQRIWMLMYVMRTDPGSPALDLAQALADAAHRGVAVQVALDVGYVWGTTEIDTKHEAPAAWLKEHGVRVVLDEPERISHGKVLVIDDRWLVVGSHNWTRSALSKNREASLIIDDPALARRLEQELFAHIPDWDAKH